MRFADLVARCESDNRDTLARTSLADLASTCRQHFPEMTERALALLALDEVSAVRMAASIGLGALLERLDGLARIRVVVDWAVSGQRRQRVAIARALHSELAVIGVVPALDQLAHDKHSDVRRAACAASARRVRDGDDAFAEIVRDSTRDERRSVRTAAIAGLLDTASRKPNPEQAIEALYDCARSKHAGSASRARRALQQLGSYSHAREIQPAMTSLRTGQSPMVKN